MKRQLPHARVVCALALVIVLVTTVLLLPAVVGLDVGNKEPPQEIRAIYRSARRIIQRHSNSPDWQQTVEAARQTIEELEAEFPTLKDSSD
jgi:hypothetical protein